MPDEGDRDPGLLVEGDLEGEEDRHHVDHAPDPGDAPASPGPHLRGDEVEDLHPLALGELGEPQVEVWVVDQDQQVGGGVAELLLEDVETFDDDREMGDHLDESHDSHDVGVHEGLDPRPSHAVPAHAEKAGFGGQGAYFIRDARTVHLAGSLTGDDHH